MIYSDKIQFKIQHNNQQSNILICSARSSLNLIQQAVSLRCEFYPIYFQHVYQFISTYPDKMMKNSPKVQYRWSLTVFSQNDTVSIMLKLMNPYSEIKQWAPTWPLQLSEDKHGSKVL